jgi:ferredoxin-NADP reductase
VLLTLSIREVIRATPRAFVVRIALDGKQFPYLPGQAVFVGNHGGQRKPYSLAASPEEADRQRALELLVGTNSEGHAGPHLTLAAGTMVDVEGPLGRFTFSEEAGARRLLFIAGGTGIAPLRAMLHRALTAPHHTIGVLYSARTVNDFAYERELRDLAAAGKIELKLAVTREAVGDEWSGTRGRLGAEDIAPLVHDAETLCFVCGPPALVHDMPKLLESLGIERHRIRIEEWG